MSYIDPMMPPGDSWRMWRVLIIVGLVCLFWLWLFMPAHAECLSSVDGPASVGCGGNASASRASRPRGKVQGEHRAVHASRGGPPTSLSCGYRMMKRKGLNDRDLWVARNWAEKFTHVAFPSVGDVGVFRRGRGHFSGHVVEVLSVLGDGKLKVWSPNGDGSGGNAVTEYPVNDRRLIAWVRVGA